MKNLIITIALNMKTKEQIKFRKAVAVILGVLLIAIIISLL